MITSGVKTFGPRMWAWIIYKNGKMVSLGNNNWAYFKSTRSAKRALDRFVGDMGFDWHTKEKVHYNGYTEIQYKGVIK